MANKEEREVIVGGGGIGGLATALGLAQSGKKVTILEAAPEFGEIGAGIQLAANATNVLKKLGVLDKISEIAVFPKRLVLMDAYSGEELSALNIDDVYRERYGVPYIVLHRSDLHRVLVEACEDHPNVELLNGHGIESVSAEEGTATVSTAAGVDFESEALIGADGLWSETRKLFVNDKPVCSEYVAYRGAIPIEEVTNVGNLDDVYMFIGPNMHVVQYPVRRGELYNQVVVFKSGQYTKEIEHTDQWGTPEEMDEVFKGTCDRIQTALSYISRQKRWPMYDREPIKNWTKDNITLMGDAAHPMLQYLAQGACQALEDAAYLTDMVNKYDSYNEAFEKYQEERQPRTEYVQASARSWGEIIHTTDEVSIMLRNALLKNRGDENFTFVDQYHGYDKYEHPVKSSI